MTFNLFFLSFHLLQFLDMTNHQATTLLLLLNSRFKSKALLTRELASIPGNLSTYLLPLPVSHLRRPRLPPSRASPLS